MRIPGLAALAFALAGGITAALADTVTIETARGPMEVPFQPQKVAVFDISAMDTIDALGVKIAGYPSRVFHDYLAHVAETGVKVGTLFEADLEAVNVMQPDLIVAGGRSSEQVEPLSALAPTIDMTIWGKDVLGQVRARLKAYGAIFGKEDKATAMDTDLMASLERVKTLAADQGRVLVVQTNGPKISVYGPGSRYGWYHEELGLTQAVENITASRHGEAVSFEYIQKVNPDWMIVVDRSAAIGQEGAAAAETLDNKLVAETTAWSKGQVIFMNSAENYVSAGGYRSLMHTLAALETAFSKSAPKTN